VPPGVPECIPGALFSISLVIVSKGDAFPVPTDMFLYASLHAFFRFFMLGLPGLLLVLAAGRAAHWRVR